LPAAQATSTSTTTNAMEETTQETQHHSQLLQMKFPYVESNLKLAFPDMVDYNN
jgi:hypothetical protein